MPKKRTNKNKIDLNDIFLFNKMPHMEQMQNQTQNSHVPTFMSEAMSGHWLSLVSCDRWIKLGENKETRRIGRGMQTKRCRTNKNDS
jgi:hypothetical protein